MSQREKGGTPRWVSSETMTLDTGEVSWKARLEDGSGGDGLSPTHSQAYRDIANYLDDREAANAPR